MEPTGVSDRPNVLLIDDCVEQRDLYEFALAREFSERMIPLFESNRLRHVIDRVFPFSEIGDAHRYMESNANFGKIVLRWGK